MRMIIILLVLFLSAGCGGDDDNEASCGEEIQAMKNQYGEPEQFDAYDADGYHSYTYWYWCMGFSRTFTWGVNVDGCEQSIYQFNPNCN